MRIAGLHKTTLLDFPGRVACIVFTRGCNFHCPYCHNPDTCALSGSAAPLEDAVPSGHDEQEVLAFLEQRRHLLQGVVLSGGEPTLHEDLPEFCARVKALGFAIKLDTNGSRPAMLETLLRADLVDYVAMDLKSAPGAYPASLCPLEAGRDVMQSLALLASWLEKGLECECRTTCVSPFTGPEASKAMIAALAETVGDRVPWYLQKARVGPDDAVLAPVFFQKEGRAMDQAELEALQASARRAGLQCEIRQSG